MYVFRSSKSLLILWSLLALALSGCWSAKKKSAEELKKSGGGSSFYVERVDGESHKTDVTRNKWGIPEEAHFTFKACLKNTAKKTAVIGRKFEVVKGSELFTTDPSGKDGCVVWAERFPFNYFADSKYISEKRTIRAIDGKSGSVDLDFKVNPWVRYRNEAMPEVATNLNEILPEEYSREIYTGVALMGDVSQRYPLWMEQTSIDIRGTENSYVIEELNRQTGYGLKIDLTLLPRVVVKKVDGSTTVEPIKKGKFKVYLNLLSEDFGTTKNHRVILNPSAASQVAEVDERSGKLHVSMKTILGLRPEGEVRVALKIVAMDAPGGLAPFEFVYNLGTHNKLEGKKTLEMTQEMRKKFAGLSYDAYLAKADNYETLMKAREVFQQEPFDFDALSVRFVRIENPGETATTRTVLFRVETCITNPSGVRMRNKKFLVRRIRDNSYMPQPVADAEEEKVPKSTDDRGCLAWVDKVTHKYYQPENYVFPKAILTYYGHHLSAQKSGGKAFEKELGMAVNPWDEKWTFGADRRSYDPSYLESLKKLRNKTPSRLAIFEYTYVTTRFRYEIDQFMNMVVKKTVLMKLFPKVLRYNNIVFGRRGTEMLRDGIYLLKVGFQKDYLDPSQKMIEIRKNDDPGKQQSHKIVPFVKKQETYESKIKSGFKTREHVSTVTKLVRVNNGIINTPIEFSMRDLRLMKIRSNLLIQLQPIDEKALLAINTFEAKVDERAEVLRGIIERDQLLSDEGAAFLKENSSIGFKEKVGRIFEGLEEKREQLSTLDPELRKSFESSHVEHLSKLVSELRGVPQNRMAYSDNSMIERSRLMGAKKGHSADAIYFDPKNIEALYEPFGLPEDFASDTIENIEVNDFTLNAAYLQHIDVNDLVEHDAGLEKRTFVGPLTLIYNGNGSNMQPTDNLDVAFCPNNDCALSINKLTDYQHEKVDNSNYEHSPYFGSIRHLKDVHVDDLIAREGKLHQEYYFNMSKAALPFNFIDFNDILYTSLEDKTLKVFDEEAAELKPKCKGYDFSQCLRPVPNNTLKLNDLVAQINDASRKRIRKSKDKSTQEELTKFVLESRSPDNFKLKVCRYMSTEFNEDGKIVSFHEPLFNMCKRRIHKWYEHLDYTKVDPREGNTEEDKSNNEYNTRFDYLDKALDVNTKYIVKRTGRYRYKGGKSMNINVNENFVVSHDFSMARGGNITWAPFDVLNAILPFGIAKIIPGIGAGTRLADIHIADRIGKGISVTSSTFLVMQTAALDVELLNYEVCKIVKWNKAFVGKQILKTLEWSKIQEDRNKVLKKRLMVCSGTESNNPVAVRERYYYFTQHFTDGDMLDPGDLSNHPWLLALRGVYDFRTFIALTKGERYNWPMEYNVPEQIASQNWPIKRLKESYMQVLPTFPGMHTVVPEEGYVPNFPFADRPRDSFRAGTGHGVYEQAVEESGGFDNSWDLTNEYYDPN